MGRKRASQQTRSKTAGLDKASRPPQLPWLAITAIGVIAAAVIAVGGVRWQTGAPHVNISSLGRPLLKTAQLISEQNLKAAAEIAKEHTNRSAHPQLSIIMTEVADGLQSRLSGKPSAVRRNQLLGLGGPLGDALASAAWSERPQRHPFRFPESFEPRRLPLPLKWPGETPDGEPSPEVTLLSARPMVVMVDNWLHGAANTSLDRLPAEYDKARASLPQPAATPQALRSLETTPRVCVEKNTPGFAAFAATLTNCTDREMAAQDDERPHCAATAALGRRKDGPLSAFTTDGGQGTVCGPMTKALDDALVRSENILFDPGASDHVDTIDGAICTMLGFDFDVDSVAAASPGAVASFLKNNTSTDARARAAIRDAYDFSTGPQLSRYRTKRQGGYKVHTDCHDFAKSQPTDRTHTAILYVSEPQGGGETTFPALGVSVEPRRGRLLVFENLLPDGTCDPRTAHESSNVHLNATADKLVVQKWFYLDRAYGEHLRSHDWQEGEAKVYQRSSALLLHPCCESVVVSKLSTTVRPACRCRDILFVLPQTAERKTAPQVIVKRSPCCDVAKTRREMVRHYLARWTSLCIQFTPYSRHIPVGICILIEEYGARVRPASATATAAALARSCAPVDLRR